MTNKFVQIRFQTSANAIQNTNHDFRKSKVAYLRNDAFHNKFENVFYIENDDKVVKQNINISYKEYNELYKKKNKRNLQKGKQSDLLTGIITLSPIINKWLSDQTVSKEQLEEAFARAVSNVLVEMGELFNEQINVHYAVIHYDEKTPHMHFALANHTSAGKPRWHELRKSGTLHKYQDAVANAFEHMNIDLTRGKKKSTAKHKSVREMHEAEAKQIIEDAEVEATNIVESAKLELDYIMQEQAIANDTNKQLQAEIKQLQAEKRKVKQNIEYSKAEKHVELTKLDAEIQTLRAKKRADKDEYNATLEEMSKRLADISSAVDAHEERYDSLAVKQLRVEQESISKLINAQRKTPKVRSRSNMR